MKTEASIAIPDGAIAPAPWDDDFALSLPLDHVICHDETGAPHFVHEFEWPWTAYHPRKKRSILHFYYWRGLSSRTATKPSDIPLERETRIRELQRLMVLVIYFSDGWKENGFGSLNIKLRGLYLIARFAEDKNSSVRNVLEEQPLLDAFLDTLSGSNAERWFGWLFFLDKLDPKRQLGFVIAKPKRLQELRRRIQHYRDSRKQHAPLPSRIYSELINNLREQVEDFETHLDRLQSLIREANHRYKTLKETKPDSHANFGPALIEGNGLTLFFERRGFGHSLHGIPSAITNAFHVCKLMIHVFSGMRAEEAQTLPYHCLVTETAGHGRKHCLIAGVTTKLEGSRIRRTKWVTTENEGFRAIRLAQRISSVIYECLGISVGTPDHADDAVRLFPSPLYLPWCAKRLLLAHNSIAPATLHVSSVRDSLIAKLCPVIEDADIAELAEIDPFRSWREEPEFAVGNRWPLSAHQLRRSVALYANASGLVRISSLRRQLQHLTREMSLYYGRGSTFCKNLFDEDPEGYKKHIALEWQDGNEEAKMLAFTIDVLRSTEPLFGGAGNYFQRQRERGQIMTHAEVQKQFKAGLLSFNEGPLGGCTKPGVCTTRKGLNLVDTACATDNCKHLIGKHSRIIQVIRLKRAAIAQVDPNSIDYAMEKEELDSLELVEADWRAESAVALKGAAHV